MTLFEIEQLEYLVASSFRDLVNLTNEVYALEVANSLVRNKEVFGLCQQLSKKEDNGNPVGSTQTVPGVSKF